MLLFGFIFLAAILTYAMFSSRQAMLGFPCAIFWAILGAYSYTLSTIPWGDIYFYLFFASMFGMTLFCAFAAYGLREIKDVGTDEDEFIDEKAGQAQSEKVEEDAYSDEEVGPSRRVQELRDRAKRRRDRGQTQKKVRWGGFK